MNLYPYEINAISSHMVQAQRSSDLDCFAARKPVDLFAFTRPVDVNKRLKDVFVRSLLGCTMHFTSTRYHEDIFKSIFWLRSDLQWPADRQVTTILSFPETTAIDWSTVKNQKSPRSRQVHGTLFLNEGHQNCLVSVAYDRLKVVFVSKKKQKILQFMHTS